MFLKSVVFKNCQSLKDEVYILSEDKLNVIIAENNVGKSILLKLLRATATPEYYSTKEERKNLITWGEEFALFGYLFSDGSSGFTRVEERRIFYGYKEKNEDNFTLYPMVPAKVLDALSMKVDRKNSFIANIIDSEQNLLLVNSSSQGNDTLLKNILEYKRFAQFLEDIDPILYSMGVAYRNLNYKYETVAHKLTEMEYMDVERAENEVIVAEEVFGVLEGVSIFDSLYESIKKIKISEGEYNMLFSIVDTTIMLDKHLRNLNYVQPKRFNKDLVTICNFTVELDNAVSLLEPLKVVHPLDEGKVALFDILMEATVLLDGIRVVEEKDITLELELCSIVVLLNSGINDLNTLASEISDHKKLAQEIRSLKRELADLNAIIDCEIYGKVIYDGETCTPYVD